jgi:hypothetical protein
MGDGVLAKPERMPGSLKAMDPPSRSSPPTGGSKAVSMHRGHGMALFVVGRALRGGRAESVAAAAVVSRLRAGDDLLGRLRACHP